MYCWSCVLLVPAVVVATPVASEPETPAVGVMSSADPMSVGAPTDPAIPAPAAAPLPWTSAATRLVCCASSVSARCTTARSVAMLRRWSTMVRAHDAGCARACVIISRSSPRFCNSSLSPPSSASSSSTRDVAFSSSDTPRGLPAPSFTSFSRSSSSSVLAFANASASCLAAFFSASTSCSALSRERSSSARTASRVASASSACSSARSSLEQSSSVPSLIVQRRHPLKPSRAARWSSRLSSAATAAPR
mmetsp:Transcript_32802/g.75888  ORF Transcript_32802/g.75888 Transcript_32802/m.75888 type:complete len:249 (-) Transcript_32802:70-816(-)